VAVSPNPATTRAYFADSYSGYDAVNRWDGSTLTTFATEEHLDPHNVSPAAPNASFMDMTMDSALLLMKAVPLSKSTPVVAPACLPRLQH